MLRLDQVRAITFDFYGTLFDDRDSAGDAPVAAALRRLQADHPQLPPVDDLLGRWRRFAMALRAPFLPWSRLRPLVLRRLLDEVGNPEIDFEPYSRLIEAQFARARPYGDALTTLRTLRRDFPIAFVSNANARLLTATWAPHALPEPVILITSEELGLYKPARGMFQAAAAALKVEPATILHVGQDAEEDILGARRTGLMAAWLNRDDAPRPADLPQDVPALRSLTALPPLLTIRPPQPG